MLVLGIETTCDETSVALVSSGTKYIKDCTITQSLIHSKYGGVIPEVASRQHLEKISIVVDEVFQNTELTIDDVDAIAVATSPGLVPALNVGYSYASGLAYSNNKKLIHINHLEAHVWANFIDNDELEKLKSSGRAVCLLVSGGHTQILEISFTNRLELKMIGETQDDAVGEAFDKVAKLIGLPYPGGPEIEKAAKNCQRDIYNFTRPMMYDGTYNFSFSGIKSNIYRLVTDIGRLESFDIENIAYSFQRAVIDVLCTKTIKYANENNINTIYLAGGVACNGYLREEIKQRAGKKDILVKYPIPKLCTDNGIMIAGIGGMLANPIY